MPAMRRSPSVAVIVSERQSPPTGLRFSRSILAHESTLLRLTAELTPRRPHPPQFRCFDSPRPTIQLRHSPTCGQSHGDDNGLSYIGYHRRNSIRLLRHRRRARDRPGADDVLAIAAAGGHRHIARGLAVARRLARRDAVLPPQLCRRSSGRLHRARFVPSALLGATVALELPTRYVQRHLHCSWSAQRFGFGGKVNLACSTASSLDPAFSRTASSLPFAKTEPIPAEFLVFADYNDEYIVSMPRTPFRVSIART